MKKLHLLFAGIFAALAIVACSDDELETGNEKETGGGNTETGKQFSDALILEYTITSDNTTIQLPLGEKDEDGNVFTIDCTVDWGDGSEIETVTSCWPSHTYSEGTYNVIINGTVEWLDSNDYNIESDRIIDGAKCLTAVKQWGNTGLKSMDFAFFCCSKLTSIPEGAGPFSNVTGFRCAFGSCRLTTVPEDMFSNCTAAEDFSKTFVLCEHLISAPSFKGLSKVTTFNQVFCGCTSLTTVPNDIFSGCTAVVDFGYVFSSCFYLESVPVGIFDDSRLATNFFQAFYSCWAMDGESPYTTIRGKKVHLYERADYPDYFSAPTSYTNCFAYSTNLDDYDDIPSSWK